jgi:hypothetical protein
LSLLAAAIAIAPYPEAGYIPGQFKVTGSSVQKAIWQFVFPFIQENAMANRPTDAAFPFQPEDDDLG